MALRQLWDRSKTWSTRKQIAAGIGISIVVLGGIGAITPSNNKTTTTVAVTTTAGATTTTPSTTSSSSTSSTTNTTLAASTTTSAATAPTSTGAPSATTSPVPAPTQAPTPAPPAGLIVVSGDETKVLGSAPTGPCTARTAANGQLLPDPACTPGAVAARVTQDNITATICASGYTATVRPSTTITNPLKQRTAAAYGLTYQPDVQEYDHVVPLELGGANDTRNLWTEPATSPTQKSTTNLKDFVEGKLHDLVCAGRIALADAQRRIATDWTTALAGL